MKPISIQTTVQEKTRLKVRPCQNTRQEAASLPDGLSIDHAFQPLRQVAVLPEEDEIGAAWRRMEALLMARLV